MPVSAFGVPMAVKSPLPATVNRVEVDFVNKYYEHLFFKRSYTNSSIMYFGGKRGIRVDRVLVCEILDQREGRSAFSGDPDNYHLNMCLKASYKYQFTKGSQKSAPNVSGAGQQGGEIGGNLRQREKRVEHMRADQDQEREGGGPNGLQQGGSHRIEGDHPAENRQHKGEERADAGGHTSDGVRGVHNQPC